MFYEALCTVCYTGLDDYHSKEECEAILRIRRKLKLQASVKLDQNEMQEGIRYEKEHGHLPELASHPEKQL